jgi:hypothetical protein
MVKNCSVEAAESRSYPVFASGIACESGIRADQQLHQQTNLLHHRQWQLFGRSSESLGGIPPPPILSLKR